MCCPVSLIARKQGLAFGKTSISKAAALGNAGIQEKTEGIRLFQAFQEQKASQ